MSLPYRLRRESTWPKRDVKRLVELYGVLPVEKIAELVCKHPRTVYRKIKELNLDKDSYADDDTLRICFNCTLYGDAAQCVLDRIKEANRKGIIKFGKQRAVQVLLSELFKSKNILLK